MRPRFQADADLNHKIVLGLRRREPVIDFQDARQACLDGKSDSEVLLLAAAADRILVSHDRKTMPSQFKRFLKNHPSPGLIILAQDLEAGTAIGQLLLAWAASEAEEWANRIGFIPF